MLKLLRSKRGEGYFDVVIVVLVVVMVLALILAAAPVVSAKIQLDNYADELVREAEIAGRIGARKPLRERKYSPKKQAFLPQFNGRGREKCS